MVPPQGSSCCGLCGAQIPGSLRIQSQAAPGALWISWRGEGGLFLGSAGLGGDQSSLP